LTTDVELEKIYKRNLLSIYPNIPIMGEELSPEIVSSESNELFWAIDPIDGTVNYSRNLPEYGTSIALIENGKPIATGLCFPYLRETYIAGVGEGAYLNGSKINVSENEELNSSLLAFGDFSVKDNHKIKNRIRFRYIEALADEVLRVRMPGSAALQLAWLSSGKVDISVTLSNNAWDVQGGILLVREAGGRVYDVDGSEHTILSQYTIASNQNIREAVLALTTKIERSLKQE
jgi:myo-inositol-1(or 4)-monophosphatase